MAYRIEKTKKEEEFNEFYTEVGIKTYHFNRS